MPRSSNCGAYHASHPWQVMQFWEWVIKFLSLNCVTTSAGRGGVPAAGEWEISCSTTVPHPPQPPTNIEVAAGEPGASYSPHVTSTGTWEHQQVGMQLRLPTACELFKGLRCQEPNMVEFPHPLLCSASLKRCLHKHQKMGKLPHFQLLAPGGSEMRVQLAACVWHPFKLACAAMDERSSPISSCAPAILWGNSRVQLHLGPRAILNLILPIGEGWLCFKPQGSLVLDLLSVRTQHWTAPVLV